MTRRQLTTHRTDKQWWPRPPVPVFEARDAGWLVYPDLSLTLACSGQHATGTLWPQVQGCISEVPKMRFTEERLRFGYVAGWLAALRAVGF